MAKFFVDILRTWRAGRKKGFTDKVGGVWSDGVDGLGALLEIVRTRKCIPFGDTNAWWEVHGPKPEIAFKMFWTRNRWMLLHPWESEFRMEAIQTGYSSALILCQGTVKSGKPKIRWLIEKEPWPGTPESYSAFQALVDTSDAEPSLKL